MSSRSYSPRGSSNRGGGSFIGGPFGRDYVRGGGSFRGGRSPAEYEDNVPANVIVPSGRNLKETVERTEEFLLAPGEKKVVMIYDKDKPSSATFTFNRDGPTLGGTLVSALLAMPSVVFAAYKTPHPLFFTFELHLTTDGSVDPKDAMIEAAKNLVEDLASLSRRFTHEWELHKQAKNGGGFDLGRQDRMVVDEVVRKEGENVLGRQERVGRGGYGRYGDRSGRIEGGERSRERSYGGGAEYQSGSHGRGGSYQVPEQIREKEEYQGASRRVSTNQEWNYWPEDLNVTGDTTATDNDW